MGVAVAAPIGRFPFSDTKHEQVVKNSLRRADGSGVAPPDDARTGIQTRVVGLKSAPG